VAVMKSPAGDMEVQFKSVGTDGSHMVMEGKFGVWDSQILLGPAETKKLIRMVLKPSIIFYVIKLPFVREKQSQGDR